MNGLDHHPRSVLLRGSKHVQKRSYPPTNPVGTREAGDPLHHAPSNLIWHTVDPDTSHPTHPKNTIVTLFLIYWLMKEGNLFPCEAFHTWYIHFKEVEIIYKHFISLHIWVKFKKERKIFQEFDQILKSTFFFKDLLLSYFCTMAATLDLWLNISIVVSFASFIWSRIALLLWRLALISSCTLASSLLPLISGCAALSSLLWKSSKFWVRSLSSSIMSYNCAVR